MHAHWQQILVLAPLAVAVAARPPLAPRQEDTSDGVSFLSSTVLPAGSIEAATTTLSSYAPSVATVYWNDPDGENGQDGGNGQYTQGGQSSEGAQSDSQGGQGQQTDQSGQGGNQTNATTTVPLNPLTEPSSNGTQALPMTATSTARPFAPLPVVTGTDGIPALLSFMLAQAEATYADNPQVTAFITAVNGTSIVEISSIGGPAITAPTPVILNPTFTVFAGHTVFAAVPTPPDTEDGSSDNSAALLRSSNPLWVGLISALSAITIGGFVM